MNAKKWAGGAVYKSIPPIHPKHMYKLIFHCKIIGGTAETSVETTEVAFFQSRGDSVI